MEVHRGEVFYADLSPVVGSEQGGVRPVLIVQNEIGNRPAGKGLGQQDGLTGSLFEWRIPNGVLAPPVLSAKRKGRHGAVSVQP